VEEEPKAEEVKKSVSKLGVAAVAAGVAAGVAPAVISQVSDIPLKELVQIFLNYGVVVVLIPVFVWFFYQQNSIQESRYDATLERVERLQRYNDENSLKREEKLAQKVEKLEFYITTEHQQDVKNMSAIIANNAEVMRRMLAYLESIKSN
jgi:uncharacterized protein YlxW (UPF0749 family)